MIEGKFGFVSDPTTTTTAAAVVVAKSKLKSGPAEAEAEAGKLALRQQRNGSSVVSKQQVCPVAATCLELGVSSVAAKFASRPAGRLADLMAASSGRQHPVSLCWPESETNKEQICELLLAASPNCSASSSRSNNCARPTDNNNNHSDSDLHSESDSDLDSKRLQRPQIRQKQKQLGLGLLLLPAPSSGKTRSGQQQPRQQACGQSNSGNNNNNSLCRPAAPFASGQPTTKEASRNYNGANPFAGCDRLALRQYLPDSLDLSALNYISSINSDNTFNESGATTTTGKKPAKATGARASQAKAADWKQQVELPQNTETTTTTAAAASCSTATSNSCKATTLEANQSTKSRVGKRQHHSYNAWTWKRPIELLNATGFSALASAKSSLSSMSKSTRRKQADPNDINNNNEADDRTTRRQAECHDDGQMKACLLFQDQQQEEPDCLSRRMARQKRTTAGSLDGWSLAAAAKLGLVVSLALVGLLSASSSQVLALQQAPPPGVGPNFRSGPSGPQPASLVVPPALAGATGAGQRGLAGPAPQPAAGSLVANINCNKIRGHVTLTPNQQGSTTVSTQISAGPVGEVYQWSVHQFPVKPGAAMCTCSPLVLGSKLIDLSELHGNLPSEQEFTVQSAIPLFGFDSPVGHSLMLRGLKTGMTACATFLPTSRKSSYRAKFHHPLSGSVTIFQTAFGTSFLSHLMYANGTRRHSAHRFDLIKLDDERQLLASGSHLAGSLANGGQLAANGAGQTGAPAPSAQQVAQEQREHDNELSQCKRLTSGESALFKNSTFQLLVSTENFGMRSRTTLVLPQIPLETFASVYVIIYSEHNQAEPIACAPLRFVRPKQAATKFQSVSVQGSVVFSQDSAYDPTVARINLQLPNSDGHSYGIDELPMIIRRKSDTRVCPNIREIIYNPHHIEPSSVPAEGEATSDQYAVGDLSGKYGSLAGKPALKITAHDYNLPLFGPNSIVGRAMTVYSADGVAIGCSNVELTTPMTTAFATFDFGIQGQFIFRQPQNDCNGDTYVYIEVSKPLAAAQATGASSSAPSSLASSQLHANEHATRSLDHNWHVHVNPVDSGIEHLSTTECSAAGGHFNPYNTSTASIYSRDCTAFNVLRCELGDLSSKMFTLEIPPYRVKSGQEPDIGKFFGTDIDLPLCGPVSIVNRSVVVHVQDFGVQRLACSTVIEFKPRAN